MHENYQRILANFKSTGFDKGKLEVAQSLKSEGFSVVLYCQITI
jgi:hypothetical protein